MMTTRVSWTGLKATRSRRWRVNGTEMSLMLTSLESSYWHGCEPRGWSRRNHCTGGRSSQERPAHTGRSAVPDDARQLGDERVDRDRAKDVGTTVTGIQTAITLYTLVMASLMITGGKIGEILGRKRAFTIGCVIYGCGSLTTALAPNLRC